MSKPPIHFSYAFTAATLCNARRQRNVRDTSRLREVTCPKCIDKMQDPQTGTLLPAFDTPQAVAAGLRGLLARKIGVDEWAQQCIARYITRLEEMERQFP